LIKHIEDVASELAWVARGEELLVNEPELDPVEMTRRAIF
jgi:hypothetical protein